MYLEKWLYCGEWEVSPSILWCMFVMCCPEQSEGCPSWDSGRCTGRTCWTCVSVCGSPCVLCVCTASQLVCSVITATAELTTLSCVCSAKRIADDWVERLWIGWLLLAAHVETEQQHSQGTSGPTRLSLLELARVRTTERPVEVDNWCATEHESVFLPRWWTYLLSYLTCIYSYYSYRISCMRLWLSFAPLSMISAILWPVFGSLD